MTESMKKMWDLPKITYAINLSGNESDWTWNHDCEFNLLVQVGMGDNYPCKRFIIKLVVL